MGQQEEEKNQERSALGLEKAQNSSFLPSSKDNSRIIEQNNKQTSFIKNAISNIASKNNSKDVSKDLIKRDWFNY